MIDVGAPLLLGLFFGALLHRGGLTRWRRIVGVYRLNDWTVMRFLLAALAVGAVVVQLVREIAPTNAVAVPVTSVGADLGGGVIFGVGMALAGFCPGTIVAGAGEGRLDALVFGVLGLFTGALIFGGFSRWIVPFFAHLARADRRALPELLDASPWLVIVLFVELVGLVLYVTTRASRPAGDAREVTAPPRSSRA